MPAYKGAIAQLTKVLALEYGEQGARADAIGVGVVETDILAGIVEYSRARLASYGHVKAFGRVAQPEEIAQTVAWLASPAPALLPARTSWLMVGIQPCKWEGCPNYLRATASSNRRNAISPCLTAVEPLASSYSPGKAPELRMPRSRLLKATLIFHFAPLLPIPPSPRARKESRP